MATFGAFRAPFFFVTCNENSIGGGVEGGAGERYAPERQAACSKTDRLLGQVVVCALCVGLALQLRLRSRPLPRASAAVCATAVCLGLPYHL